MRAMAHWIFEEAKEDAEDSQTTVKKLKRKFEKSKTGSFDEAKALLASHVSRAKALCKTSLLKCEDRHKMEQTSAASFITATVTPKDPKPEVDDYPLEFVEET